MSWTAEGSLDLLRCLLFLVGLVGIACIYKDDRDSLFMMTTIAKKVAL